MRATADTLADLIVEDLTKGSADLRRRIPILLQELVDAGTLMLINDEYRLQTRESAEWEADFRKRYARILADDPRIAADRDTELRNAIAAALKGLILVQGESKTPRKYVTHFEPELPPTGMGAVPLWIRDGWSMSERSVREEAQAAGIQSPIVSLFLPNREPDALKAALAAHAAARECLDSRPVPSTAEGAEARQAMHSRVYLERRKLDALIAIILDNALVFLGGGYEPLTGGSTLQATVKEALESALVRLFPKFPVADKPGWGTVVTRASQGAADALAAVGYHGDAEKHPVCAEIRQFIGGAGKRGQEIRKRFTGDGYGWPQDAVDGALLVLVGGGFVRASRNAQPLAIKEIVQSQIGAIDFYGEGVPPTTASQRIEVRSMITGMGFPCKPGEEAAAIPLALQRLVDLAAEAGGAPPLPERPSAGTIQDLQALGGNEQFIRVWERNKELLSDFQAWTRLQKLIAERQPRWERLQHLLRHAKSLSICAEVSPQVEAIRANRSLLAEPDPVAPLAAPLAAALRAALQDKRTRLQEAHMRELRDLEASEEWRALDGDERESILDANGLGAVPALDIGTDEALLTALDDTPLEDWDDKIAALPERATAARTAAAALVAERSGARQPVTVRPPSATLKTAADVDAYLARLREKIMVHIAADTPVIV